MLPVTLLNVARYLTTSLRGPAQPYTNERGARVIDNQDIRQNLSSQTTISEVKFSFAGVTGTRIKYRTEGLFYLPSQPQKGVVFSNFFDKRNAIIMILNVCFYDFLSLFAEFVFVIFDAKLSSC